MSRVEIGDIWGLGVFRLSQEQACETVVGRVSSSCGRDWSYSRKFGRTNPFGSFACLRIRRDSHRHSIQDQCGGSRRSPGLDCMGTRTKSPLVEPSVEVLIAPGKDRGG